MGFMGSLSHLAQPPKFKSYTAMHYFP